MILLDKGLSDNKVIEKTPEGDTLQNEIFFTLSCIHFVPNAVSADVSTLEIRS